MNNDRYSSRRSHCPQRSQRHLEIFTTYGLEKSVNGVAKSAPPLPKGTSVIVLSGPGGVGKGTIVDQLLTVEPRLWISRSWTTRDRRPGEDPHAYYFASPEEFHARREQDGFLEWAAFLDYYQGSPIPEPPANSDVLFEIDVQGAANILRLYPRARLIFVDAPDRTEQERRMKERGDAPERIQQRLEKAEEEVQRSLELPYTYVINDDLQRVVAEILGLIKTSDRSE